MNDVVFELRFEEFENGLELIAIELRPRGNEGIDLGSQCGRQLEVCHQLGKRFTPGELSLQENFFDISGNAAGLEIALRMFRCMAWTEIEGVPVLPADPTRFGCNLSHQIWSAVKTDPLADME